MALHFCGATMPLSSIDIDPCNAVEPSGLGTLQFAPLDEVNAAAFDVAINAAYNQQEALGLIAWYDMPYAPGSGSWNEVQQEGEQGTAYAVSVSALLPASTPAIRGQLDAMRNRRYLLRLNKGGQLYLIGTPDTPLRFSSRFDSGSDAADTRGHQVEWKGFLIKKTPAYVPVF